MFVQQDFDLKYQKKDLNSDFINEPIDSSSKSSFN